MIDMPKLNFSKAGVFDKVPERNTVIVVDTWISLKHSVGLVERSLRAKNQLDPFIHFDRTPTCDRQTDTHTHTHTHKHGHRLLPSLS